MAADTLEGKREAIVSEYILRILGLDVRNQLRHRLSCFAVHFPFLSHSVCFEGAFAMSSDEQNSDSDA